MVLQCLVLILLVYPFVDAVFRDNDQATILDGAWRVAHHQASFLHATFYNFDKQWGVFLGLSWLYRLFPSADPVWSGNVLVAALASLAWLSLGFRTGRTRNTPIQLLLPVLLSPVLILYMPYLGTGWFSLALLLLSFFFLGIFKSRASQASGVILFAAAAACRGDVVLATPALALSQLSRGQFSKLLRRPLLWLIAAAAVLPVLAGKIMAGSSIADTNPLSFDARSYFGFLLFGLTPAAIILLAFLETVFVSAAMRKHRFWFFYLCLGMSPLIPFLFYSLQLYTLRYLFLTIACILFLVSSRRSVALYHAISRKDPQRAFWLALVLVGITVAPWIGGFNMPLLNRPRLTFTNPTRFPTGDGKFPMGAYLGFEWQILFRDHLQIDHNQKIWLAARSVIYQPCSDGTVPFLITPMSNFIEFAIRLQNKRPLPIDYIAESPCGMAYVDVRSIIRGYRPVPRDGAMFEERISFVSSTDGGQIIAFVEAKGGQTDEARILEQLKKVLGQHDVEIFTGRRLPNPDEPGLRYATFSEKACREPARPEAICTHGLTGWARTTLPEY
ncbi:MAG: hypothetical protein JO210_15790, partial [Acidobacteriaceae bacterium]|nr:hypothetical protein [Acidobacteriaceae bacterium]